MVNPATRKERARRRPRDAGVRRGAGFGHQRLAGLRRAARRAHIVNVGCDIAQMRIAAPADLDRAVVLGLSYPRGPLAMGDTLGAGKILTILESMHAIFQEPALPASPWLRAPRAARAFPF